MNDKIKIGIFTRDKACDCKVDCKSLSSVIENSIPKWLDYLFDLDNEFDVRVDILVVFEDRIDVLINSKRKLFIKDTFYILNDISFEYCLEQLWNSILYRLILSGAVKCIDDLKQLNK
jgi:hypothetical protein